MYAIKMINKLLKTIEECTKYNIFHLIRVLNYKKYFLSDILGLNNLYYGIFVILHIRLFYFRKPPSKRNIKLPVYRWKFKRIIYINKYQNMH